MRAVAEIWSMRDGVSQCWKLSKYCTVDWEAWAAIGTVTAVLVALFGPAIQRRFVRKKTNALFALSYRSSVVAALGRLRNLDDRFPLDPAAPAAWQVHSSLTRKGDEQANFLQICERLSDLSGREVDLTKWGAADLDLAAKISVAIESTGHFQLGADTLSLYSEHTEWVLMMTSVHYAHVRAVRDVQAASDAIHKALSAYKVTASMD